MTALNRLLTFAAVVGTGGFLLAALASPASTDEVVPTQAEEAAAAAPADFSNDKAALANEETATEAEAVPSAVDTSSKPKSQRKTFGDGKTFVGHDGKEFKEILPPIAEGPTDVVDPGAPELPGGLETPAMPPVLREGF